MRQLREESREEPELSTKLLRLVPEMRTRALFSTSSWKMHLTMQVVTEMVTDMEAVFLMRLLGAAVLTEVAASLQRGLSLQRPLREATSRPRGCQESNSFEGSGETTLSRQT